MDLTSLLGTASSIFSNISLGSEYPDGQDWKGWDALDRKYNEQIMGNQARHWLRQVATSQPDNKVAIADITGYINMVGMSKFLDLAKQANIENRHPKTTPTHFYNYFKNIGKEEDGKIIANEFSRIAFPNERLPFPQQTGSVSGLTSNVSSENLVSTGGVKPSKGIPNQPQTPKAKKTGWILPTVIGVSAVAIIGTIIYIRRK